MEKVIREIKLIEMEDCFQIEIQDDKEINKEFMKDFRGLQVWSQSGRRDLHLPWNRITKVCYPIIWMHMA